ncbi:EamA family transporter [Streptomyces nodosus]|uniref:hypothetical protein n=1 Tax=Streptomyces nodosus TaxID=40318 RepID=UPI00380E5FBA
MPVSAYAAVLAAAVLHAVWNSMAHRIPDKLVAFALINCAYTLGAGLLVCLTPLPTPAAWPFIAASAALEVTSQLFLLRAYQLGDFGQMYPLARGLAPLLVAVASVAFLGAGLSPLQCTGVLLVSGGLAALALASGRIGRAQLPALGAAACTGVIIAGYTLVDATGVRQGDSSHWPPTDWSSGHRRAATPPPSPRCARPASWSPPPSPHCSSGSPSAACAWRRARSS